MNRKQTKQYLLQKDNPWQKIYCSLYLAQHQLCESDLIRPFNITDTVRFCQSENDFIALWELIDFVDESDDIYDEISDMYFTKPVAWQYDFVASVAEESGYKIVQRLDMDALSEAYCIGLLNCNIEKIQHMLDAKYEKLVFIMREKAKLIKRNLLLELESRYGQRTFASFDDISFQQILQLYGNCASTEVLIEALKRAQMKELRWESEEADCLAFAYYSPFFCDEVNLAQHKLPDSSLFANVYDYMRTFRKIWEQNGRPLSFEQEADDDTPDLTNDAIFIDQQEECIMVVRCEKALYANIYIQRYPVRCLRNAMPDFIAAYRGCLFTVEYVDSLSDVPAASQLMDRIRKAEKRIGYLQQKIDKLPQKKDDLQKLRMERCNLQLFVSNCYCVYIS